jgi:hypothetical protein
MSRVSLCHLETVRARDRDFAWSASRAEHENEFLEGHHHGRLLSAMRRPNSPTLLMTTHGQDGGPNRERYPSLSCLVTYLMARICPAKKVLAQGIGIDGRMLLLTGRPSHLSHALHLPSERTEVQERPVIYPYS